jgi:hypothetical protein
MSNDFLWPGDRVIVENQWQAIETAPKDGTSILLYDPVGDWTDETRTMDIGHWGLWGWGESTWLMNGGDGWGKPTHWQPLPAPPQTGEVG